MFHSSFQQGGNKTLKVTTKQHVNNHPSVWSMCSAFVLVPVCISDGWHASLLVSNTPLFSGCVFTGSSGTRTSVRSLSAQQKSRKELLIDKLREQLIKAKRFTIQTWVSRSPHSLVVLRLYTLQSAGFVLFQDSGSLHSHSAVLL